MDSVCNELTRKTSFSGCRMDPFYRYDVNGQAGSFQLLLRTFFEEASEGSERQGEMEAGELHLSHEMIGRSSEPPHAAHNQQGDGCHRKRTDRRTNRTTATYLRDSSLQGLQETYGRRITRIRNGIFVSRVHWAAPEIYASVLLENRRDGLRLAAFCLPAVAL